MRVIELDDPSVPAWITEGAKKSDAAAAHGLLCLSIKWGLRLARQ